MLIKTVRFFDYAFDAEISGEYNEPAPPFGHRFRHHGKPSGALWVAFSGWGTHKRKPVTREITITIAPVSQAMLSDMLGTQKTLQPGAWGNVTLTTTSSPIHLIVRTVGGIQPSELIAFDPPGFTA